MRPNLTVIPLLKMHPDKIIAYNSYHWDPVKPERKKNQPQSEEKEKAHINFLQSRRTADGKLSKIATKKISTAIDYLMLLSSKKTVALPYEGKNISFRVAFITLTLSSKQIHSDNEIKAQLLDSLLIELRKKYGVTLFVWRAEKQKNGSIHFHILIDKFVYWVELRDIWNRIQNKLGYVDRYREKMKTFHKKGFKFNKELSKYWDYEKQKAAYLKGAKTDFQSPNSIDIHSLKKIKNVKNYVKKYVAKDEKKVTEIEEKVKKAKISLNSPDSLKKDKKKLRRFRRLAQKAKALKKKLLVKGRIWGCSYNLTGLTGAIVEADSEVQKVVEALREIEGIRIYQEAYFTIFYFDISALDNRWTRKLFQKFQQYVSNHFGIPIEQKLNFAA